MFLVRDIMYCKPGKARAMVDKFVALSAISQKMGMGATRVMTDVSAERYWTVVSEMEVPSLDALSDRATKAMGNPEFQAAMQATTTWSTTAGGKSTPSRSDSPLPGACRQIRLHA